MVRLICIVFSFLILLVSGCITRTHIEVFDGTNLKEIIVNEADILVQGQTSGEWVFLGNFQLPKGDGTYVVISNKNANGVIVADAILAVINQTQ